ncbi:MAG: EAL domain-containing protein [Gloeomargaritaceae cyanobacterium C42_A2020_066]|nr:EAL domain-containing protein [Gloeomargaritaceae cyanobacterium C42_A2020_066]
MRPWLAAGLVTSLVVVGAKLIHDLALERHLKEQRETVAFQATRIQAQLENALYQRLYLARGISGFVALRPDLTQAEFERYARQVLQRESGVRALALARQTVISHTYPYESNRAALGLELLKHPVQSEAVRRAIALRRTVVAGPVDLVQGGVGFISRTPIYIMPGEQYWGIINLVIDRDTIYREAGLLGEYPDLRLALRGEDGKGPAGRVFFGDPALFDQEPVLKTILLPAGEWQLAAAPAQGWRALPPWVRYGWLSGALAAVFAGGLTFFLATEPIRLRQAVLKATADLEDSKQRYQALFQYANDAILVYTLDPSGRPGPFLEVNQVACHLLGVGRVALLQRTPQDIHTPETQVQLGMIWQRLNLDRHIVYEATYQTPCGSRRMEVSAHLFSLDGRPTVLEVARDITERQQAEQNLRETAQRLALLVQQTPLAVIEWDLDSRVCQWNQAAEEIFGYTKAEALGRLPTDLMVPATVCPFVTDLWSRLLAGESDTVLATNENCTRDGRAIVCEWYNTPLLNPQGRVVGVLSLAQDVTERHQAEADLRRRDQILEAVSHLSSLFLTEVDWEKALPSALEALGRATVVSRIHVNQCDGVEPHCLSSTCRSDWRAPTYGRPAREGSALPEDVLEQGLLTLQSGELFTWTAPPTPEALDQSILLVPVTVGSTWWGFLELEDCVPARNWSVAERDALRTVAYLLGAAIERNQADQILRESQLRYLLAEQATNDGLWDWNPATGTVYYSPRWLAMLGLEVSEGYPSLDTWMTRIHPDDRARVQAKLDAQLAGTLSHFEDEHRVQHTNGTYLWMLVRGMALRDAEGRAYRVAGSQTNVDEQRRAEAQLFHDAFHDALTGLPNRALLMDRLHRAAAAYRRQPDQHFAVLYLDFDRFKVINDSLGHCVGDQLLIAFGVRLRNCLRAHDMVARLGGDEFALLLEEVRSLEEVTGVAERILAAVEAPFQVEGHEVYITTSIGISLSTTGFDQPADLLRDADIAMYQAKAQGKARYEIFQPTYRRHVVALLQLETDLRRAIEREEFRVYYQPIVHLKTGTTAGFEALVRWQHPQRGLVSPGEFIPLAEETGLISEIGAWVLREACRQLHEWTPQPVSPGSLTMSVNLASAQLTRATLAEEVRHILEILSLAAGRIHLEITEGLIRQDVAPLQVLKDLDALGVALHIDDFGTGHSSLSRLMHLPIRALKIDRSFISPIQHPGEHGTIVRTIVNLAHSLKMQVIAEGIETETQALELYAMGCDFGQGYLFSPPVPAQVAAELVSRAWVILPFTRSS